jgi:prepilin-type N-terminal cleavage/methylation domain-containing protein
MRRGFTLIELLVVVVILAILAGIVIGLFRNTSRDARVASTQEIVRQTQQSIALFKDYTGELPNLIASWSPITEQTTVSGRTVGPFVDRVPKNLAAEGVGNPSCITDGNAPVLYYSTCTFLYDYAGGAGSGRFIASYEENP